MIKKVVVLSGKANIGKSYTVLKVYKMIISQYESVLSALSEHADIENLERTDIRVIVTINGIKVAIESQGDPGGRLVKSLKLFVKEECNLIICTTRTRGQTINTVNKLEQHGYEIIWFKQNTEPNIMKQESGNLKMAKTIFGEIKEIIGNIGLIP
ncbi:hypothetical protein ACFLXX_03155 [Chloroflexota bacterium]